MKEEWGMEVVVGVGVVRGKWGFIGRCGREELEGVLRERVEQIVVLRGNDTPWDPGRCLLLGARLFPSWS